MQFATKYLSIYLYIFIITTSSISCIIEIPLYPIEDKGIPKYRNISISKKYEQDNKNNFISFAEKGDTSINANKLFIAKINIGKSNYGGKQSFNLLLDTGSSILWVVRKSSWGGDLFYGGYDPEASRTSIDLYKSFRTNYGDRYCYGSCYSETMEYLPKKEFNMSFGAASSVYSKLDNCYGVIGLSKVYDDKKFSFIHMLKEFKNTDSLAFSIKFENDNFSPNVRGTMYIGEHEDFSKKEAVSVPLTFFANKMFWECSLSSFGLNNTYDYVYSNSGSTIKFDTGTSEIILPMIYLQEMQMELYKLKCSIIKEGGYYSIYQLEIENKEYVPDLIFKIGRHTFTFPSKYAFYLNDKGKYISSFSFQQTSSIAIIGTPFFFAFHTLFDADKDEMKFYPLKGAKIERGSGLSAVAIVFIVIGCLVFVAGLILIIYCYIKRRKNNQEENIIQNDNIKEDIMPLNEA